MHQPDHFTARLVSARCIAPSVRELVFEREEGSIEFQPGQWVNLILPPAAPDGHELRRSYSIASPPDGTPRFELAVTRVEGGPGSNVLHALEPGARLKAIGPQGFFTRPSSARQPTLFVGTGTGVTPLRSMLRAALAHTPAAGTPLEPLWLLMGVRNEADLLYRDELEQLRSEHPEVRVVFTLSRAHDGWAGKRGYVQEHVPELWEQLSEAAGGAAPHLYVCGLERMVKSVRELVRKQLLVPREQVHSERYD
jgi:CDP-4-dehydro-6-deoxyglucose reductase, E3